MSRNLHHSSMTMSFTRGQIFRWHARYKIEMQTSKARSITCEPYPELAREKCINRLKKNSS